MTHSPTDILNNYLDSPGGSLVLDSLQIGRVKFGKMTISDRDGAFNAQDIINAVLNKTARVRSGKHGTRYSEPLPPGSPARLLSIEIGDFSKHQRRRNLKSATIKDYARTLNLLLLTCGDIPVSRIDHTHIERLWDLLRWAPPAFLQDEKLRAMTVDEVIALGQTNGVQGASHATLHKHNLCLTNFFRRLVATRAIPGNPMTAMGKIKKNLVTDPIRGKKAERFLEDSELQTIFDPEGFLAWAKKWPHRWWCPILALYTGARVNELAQLKLHDIVNENGIWCIAIQLTVDDDLADNEHFQTRQTVKGASALRRIPIHQAVLDAGFLDFVQDIKACGHPRLFPNLSAGFCEASGETTARYSQGVVIQFSAYLKKLGFGRGIGFHAFRHTLSSKLKHARVPQEDIASITGHSENNRFPVLNLYQTTENPEERVRQVAALQRYNPPVVLPRYERGQFRKQLGRDTKFYP
ncbi:integrase [Stenotrophomonas rhizophila]|nr:integrase [Stenotrophomonas rhizophila]